MVAYINKGDLINKKRQSKTTNKSQQNVDNGKLVICFIDDTQQQIENLMFDTFDVGVSF